MTAEARCALVTIQQCLKTDHDALTVRFREPMDKRGLFWVDVLAVIAEPSEVHSPGTDDCNRPKWVITGDAASAREIGIVCAIETDDSEAEFITH